jgi:tRNA1(Val) A37 N6-methylase TrmN6
MNALAKIFFEFRLSLSERGIKNTLLIIIATLHGYWEDCRYGLSTASWVSVDNFDVDQDKQLNSSPYAPTTNLSLKSILKKLNLQHKNVFLDLGCGKGRVLLFAITEGFKYIRGVEFSPILQNIAKKNCEQFLAKKCLSQQKRRQKLRQQIQILEMDARDYQFLGDEGIIFMFDPFSKEVLKTVIKNMKKSLAEQKNNLTIIYRSPVHKELFDRDSDFSLILEEVSWGHDFSVYNLKC